MALTIGKGIGRLAGFRKEWIPWGMAAGRAVLGPVLVAAAACAWNPLALAAMVVTALLSDIFDGVLARRWGSDTPALRLSDSMADTIFYLCTAAALWLTRPEVLRSNAHLLAILLALEAARFAFDLAKFGKPASYHSWLAKTWGLVMAISITAVFATGRANKLLPVALALGIACNLEGIVMSLVLPVWRRDVAWLGAAWKIRAAQSSRVTPVARKVLASALVVAGMLPLAAPAFAVSTGEAAYVGGTTAGISNETLGTLDTAATENLVFRWKRAAAGATSEIDIPYARITNFQYSTEVAYHIGVLPAIAVSLLKRRERKHFFTITYADSSKATQVAVFEVPKDQPMVLLPILRARAPQACTQATIGHCGGQLAH